MFGNFESDVKVGGDEGIFARYCRQHGLRPDEVRRRHAVGERDRGHSEQMRRDGPTDSLAHVKRKAQELAEDEDLLRLVERNKRRLMEILAPDLAEIIAAVVKQQGGGHARR